MNLYAISLLSYANFICILISFCLRLSSIVVRGGGRGVAFIGIPGFSNFWTGKSGLLKNNQRLGIRDLPRFYLSGSWFQKQNSVLLLYPDLKGVLKY